MNDPEIVRHILKDEFNKYTKPNYLYDPFFYYFEDLSLGLRVLDFGWFFYYFEDLSLGLRVLDFGGLFYYENNEPIGGFPKVGVPFWGSP